MLTSTLGLCHSHNLPCGQHPVSSSVPVTENNVLSQHTAQGSSLAVKQNGSSWVQLLLAQEVRSCWGFSRNAGEPAFLFAPLPSLQRDFFFHFPIFLCAHCTDRRSEDLDLESQAL